MTRTLENLLIRLRAGDVRPGDPATARALVAGDARIPAELRDAVFRSADECADDAAGVLAVLGLDDLGAVLSAGIREEVAALGSAPWPADEDAWAPLGRALAEGLAAEAAAVDVTEAVVRRLPLAAFAHGQLVGDAVAREAGGVEVADGVDRDLGHAGRGTPVGAAVRALSGEADVSRGVLEALGFASPPVAEAVRAEAGDVDVAGAVGEALALGSLGPDLAAAVRQEAGRVDVVPGVMAAIGAWRAEVPAVDGPVLLPARGPARAANQGQWGFAGFALAAAVLISVVVGRLAIPVDPVITAAELQPVFAHAGEVVIEDLQYGDNVQVLQTEGDDGAVVLFIDEEA